MGDKEKGFEWCLECEVLFALLQTEIGLGVGMDVLMNEAQLACEAIPVDWITPIFCEGWLERGFPILYTVLGNPSLTPQDGCGEVMTYVGCTANGPGRNWT